MEILGDEKPHEDAMRELYEASSNGCVSSLNTLIKKYPLILKRVSLCRFTETPLHIASLLGHLELCEILLQNSPDLASDMDSEGRCPLHLASAVGHTEVVKTLLRTNPDTCLARDKDDMLPLHFAAMRGHVGAIKELVNAKPDSIREMTETDDGSVLHLCVRYNHLEALKLLLESLRGDHQFLSLNDREGNSLLHLAVKHGKTKIIKYLLSLSEISTEINTSNMEGLTAIDVFECYQRDPLVTHNDPTQTSTPSRTNNDPPRAPATLVTHNDPPRVSAPSLTHIDRSQLMVAATVIATMTFQSVISPPGGVWQGDTIQDGHTCPNFGFCEAGTAVVGYAWSPDFLKFVFLNSSSFFASLCVMLLIMSGFQLENKVVMWTLAFLMIVAASCMLLTYMWALGLISPNHIYYRIRKLGYLLVGTWAFLLLLVGVIQIRRIVIWARSRARRNSSTNAPPTQNSPTQ
uniref:Ankyrin repeat-containing protein At3g12360 family n=1 Tax=Cajanus cajan TaxID=3821 RepID=A0A151TUV9_CAJCA|nr:Ankyrin repeat-containing protein At3g12360 family [Cajanus cajan]